MMLANEQRRIVADLDGLPPSLHFGDRQAKVNAFPLTLFGDDVRGLQAQTRAELDALMPSILDKAFKGEL